MSNSIYIPPELLAVIQKQASNENRSVSNYIQTAVRHYLQQRPARTEASQ